MQDRVTWPKCSTQPQSANYPFECVCSARELVLQTDSPSTVSLSRFDRVEVVDSVAVDAVSSTADRHEER